MAISRGFQGRRRSDADPARVPPGESVTRDFPVLSAGPTSHTPLADWDFTVGGMVEEPVTCVDGVPGVTERDDQAQPSSREAFYGPAKLG